MSTAALKDRSIVVDERNNSKTLGESESSHLEMHLGPEVPTPQKPRSMKTWGWLLLVALSFLAGRSLFGLGGHSERRITLGDMESMDSATTTAMIVTAEPIAERLVQRTINAVGTLNAYEEIVLSSKVEGRVRQIHFDVSSAVGPEDMLLQLDSTDAELAVTQAERSLQTELAKWGFDTIPDEKQDLSQLPAVLSAKYKYELAKSRFERIAQLQASKSISIDDYEQSRSEVQILESEWKNQQLLAKAAAATARLRAADLAIAKQRLADCDIRVPQPSITDRSGSQEYVVSERLVSEGTLLRPGTEVFRLVLGKTLKLRLAVPEANSSKVQVGQLVSVFPSASTEPVEGRVSKIAPSVDRATRTFLVEVEVPNESGRYKPGGFAKASILVGDAERAVTVPSSSIYSLAGIQKIFVIDQGLVREHHVQLGEQTKDWIEISEPKLPAGIQVITSGQRLLSDGAAVTVRNSESTSAGPSAFNQEAPALNQTDKERS